MLLTMVRGDKRNFALSLSDADGAIDLSDLNLTFTAKRRLTDTDDRALFAKTIGDGITLDDDPTSGLATLTLESDDTHALADRMLVWDLQVDDGNGDVKTPLSGELLLAADVTQSSGAGS